MISMLVLIWDFTRSMGSFIVDPHLRRLLFLVIVLLAAGTIAMYTIEGWGVVDSFYFSVITLTTVGFGDLTPATTLGKLFTVFYVLSGIGIIVAFVNALGERRLARSRPVRHRPSSAL